MAVSLRPTPVLHLQSYTAVTGLGRGNDARTAALAERHSALAPCRFETVRLDTMVAEVSGLEDVELRADLAAFDCRNNRLALTRRCEQDGFDDAVARRARALRRGSRRRASSAPAPRASCRPSSPTGGATPRRRAARRLRYRRDAQHLLARRLRRGARSGSTDRRCGVSTACSSSAKVFGAARAHDRGRADRRGGRRRRRHACASRRCTASIRSSCCRREPCRPFDARARRHLDRRGGGVRAARARRRRRRRRWLLGVGESSDAPPHVTPHPEGAGAIARDARGAGRRRTAAGDDRLHQPARHRDADQRRGRGPRRARACSATPRRAARPRARPATRSARPARIEAVIALLALGTACMPGRPATRSSPIRRCARAT